MSARDDVDPADARDRRAEDMPLRHFGDGNSRRNVPFEGVRVLLAGEVNKAELPA